MRPGAGFDGRRYRRVYWQSENNTHYTHSHIVYIYAQAKSFL